jgi:hypothetical protein
MADKNLLRKSLLRFVIKYWWLLLIIVGVIIYVTGIPIFEVLLTALAIVFLLFLFLPFVVSLFSPIFALIISLVDHFQQSKNNPVFTKYLFIPCSIIAASSFALAQIILTTWVFIISFFIWAETIGFTMAFILMFFVGLAPLAILTSPFVVWYNSGFLNFLGVVTFFLFTGFWYAFSQLAFSEDYYSSTPESFLGYSPQIFLLGALSFQALALPFYKFKLFEVGNYLSYLGGYIFLILALIAAFKWHSVKKRLTDFDTENLYRPPIWIYIIGVLFTTLLYDEFERLEAPPDIIFWLRFVFLVALISKLLGLLWHKVSHLIKIKHSS